jgi:glutaminyl-peptide cyclotransferase
VKVETGEVLQTRNVAAQYFGEGITVRGNELFQLTWQTGVGFVYDRQTFAPKRQFKYAGEGWGLTRTSRRSS